MADPDGTPTPQPQGVTWQKIGGNPDAPATVQEGDPNVTFDEDHYGSVPQQALAGFEAFNRARTFGISDLLEKNTGLTSLEDIHKREEQNPGTEMVAGAVPGILASTATGGFGLAAPAGAGLGRTLLGAAGEGAIFGGAQSVTDAVLGDPNLNAQKIMANLESGVKWGLGLGALSHTIGALPALLRRAPKAVEGVEAGVISPEQALKDEGFPPPIPPTAAEQAVNATSEQGSQFRQGVPLDDMKPEDAEPIVSGLNKLKPNADEIIEAGKQMDGAATSEAMLSNDIGVQKTAHALANSASPEGIKQGNALREAWNTASGAVSKIFGPETDQSLAEVGNQAKQIISDGFEAKRGPVNELYSAVEESLPGIQITKKSTNALSRNILKVIEEEGIATGTPEHNFLNTYADNIQNVDNIQKLQKFRTALGRATSKETQFVSGIIKEKLDNLEINAIKRAADTMKTPAAREKVLGLIDQIQSAKAGYAALRDDMTQIGRPLWGNRKIYGPQDFLNAIDDMTPEVFAKRLFSKNNAEALQFMNENFPEAISLLSNYEKASLRKVATTGGAFNPKAALKAVDHIPKEAKNIMFNPAEQAKLHYGKVYFDNFLPNFNPSGTAGTISFMDALKNPIAYMTNWAKDISTSKVNNLKVNLNLTPEQQAAVNASKEKAAKLSYIAKKIKQVNNTISEYSDNLLTGGRAAILQPAIKYSDQKYDEITGNVKQITQNPQKMVDEMSQTTQHLHNAAPNITQGIYQNTSQALKYLNDIMPKPSPSVSPMPLDQQWTPTKAQKQSFMKSYDAIDNPLGVLKNVKNGIVSAEAMQALQAVHPQLLQEMRQSILSKMNVEKAQSLPYTRKLSLSQFLGQPLDTSMTSQAILSNQSTFGAPQLSQQNRPNTRGKSTQSGLKEMKFANRSRTATQQPSEES